MSSVPINRPKPLPSNISKKLPSHLEAERILLAAILLDNAAFKKIAEKIVPDDFFHDHHRRIYVAMLEMAEDELPIDLVPLTDRLESKHELEAVGGNAYISQLMDGMPRITNLNYYATILREKTVLRNLIHAASAMQTQALDGEEDAETILLRAGLSLGTVSASLAGTNGNNPAVVVGFSSLLSRECAPVEYAIEPLLSSRGTGEIFAWRGTGKSYITTQMAVDISTGRAVMFGGHRGGGGHWPISRAYRTLYVYGEMDDSEIKQRAQALVRMAKTAGEIPTDDQLGTMCKDYQKSWRPKLSTAKDRKYIEDRIFGHGYEGLILDNVSTLWPTSQENQSDRSAILAEWFTDLNQRGVWVIFLHHAGKSGEQRGDSEKEDMLSFVLKLRRPANYKAEEGLRVEVHVEKNRHKPSESRWLMPFEIALAKDAGGETIWTTRPAQEAQRRAAFEMFKNDMPAMFVGQEVGVSRATIYRWKKQYDEHPNPDFHTEPDSD
jgi:replicative DNA helicase